MDLISSIVLTALFIVLSLLSAPKIVRNVISINRQYFWDIIFVAVLAFISRDLKDTQAAFLIAGNVIVTVIAARIFLLFKERKHNPDQEFEITTEMLEKEDCYSAETWRIENARQTLRNETKAKRKQYQSWYRYYTVFLLLALLLTLAVRLSF